MSNVHDLTDQRPQKVTLKHPFLGYLFFLTLILIKLSMHRCFHKMTLTQNVNEDTKSHYKVIKNTHMLQYQFKFLILKSISNLTYVNMLFQFIICRLISLVITIEYFF